MTLEKEERIKDAINALLKEIPGGCYIEVDGVDSELTVWEPDNAKEVGGCYRSAVIVKSRKFSND